MEPKQQSPATTAQEIIRTQENSYRKNLIAFLCVIIIGVGCMGYFLKVHQSPLLVCLTVAFVIVSAIETFDKRLLQMKQGMTFPDFPNVPMDAEWKPALLAYWVRIILLGFLAYYSWPWAIVIYIGVFFAACLNLEKLGHLLVGRFYH